MCKIIHLKFCITWQVVFNAYLYSGILGFSYKMIFLLVGFFLVHGETTIFHIITQRACKGGIFGDNSGISLYFSITNTYAVGNH